MKNPYASLSLAMADLPVHGYTEAMNLGVEGTESKNLKKKGKAGNQEVFKFYRFKGMTNPGDNTIHYIIETHDGQKGLLADVHGADQGEISPKMIKKISIYHDE